MDSTLFTLPPRIQKEASRNERETIDNLEFKRIYCLLSVYGEGAFPKERLGEKVGGGVGTES